MKAIVVFLAKQKNYGLVLVMQRFPPKQRGQAISVASLLKSGQDIGFEIFHGKNIWKTGWVLWKFVLRSGANNDSPKLEKVQLKS